MELQFYLSPGLFLVFAAINVKSSAQWAILSKHKAAYCYVTTKFGNIYDLVRRVTQSVRSTMYRSMFAMTTNTKSPLWHRSEYYDNTVSLCHPFVAETARYFSRAELAPRVQRHQWHR